MTALVKKIKNGRAYWYATESARVDGQPRVVRQRYLGTVEAIEAAFDAAYEPESIDVVEFGATAAMWSRAPGPSTSSARSPPRSRPRTP